MRISSSAEAAQSAVSRFAAVQIDSTGTQASIASSNLEGMHAGERIANRILDDMASLVSSLQEQAGEVRALAALIEQRDNDDAAGMG